MGPAPRCFGKRTISSCATSVRHLCVIEISGCAEIEYDSVFTFLALMLSGCVPIVHMYIVRGVEGVESFPLTHIALMGVCYLLGACLYVSHWPEERWPYAFDIWVGAALQSLIH